MIIGGRLTADPDLKTTPSGVSVTSFTIAVNRKTAKSGETPPADFLNVTAWRQTAEFITRYFRKSSSIGVVGSWTAKDGQKRHPVEIVADEAYFVAARSEMTQPAANVQAGTQAPQSPTYIPEAYTQAPSFGEIDDGEELPF